MEYQYAGVELTQGVFADLLVLLFDGKQFNRQTAINVVTKYHREHGGILTKPSYESTFKKATKHLSDKGIRNVGYGVWRLQHEKSTVEMVAREEPATERPSADREIGKGAVSVYVFYYDSYKKLAEIAGKTTWPCKIGRTDRDPVTRAFGQSGTSYPEFPHIALIINCDDSAVLEKALHSVLQLQGKWIDNAPGKEWFDTSPEEVEALYRSLKAPRKKKGV